MRKVELRESVIAKGFSGLKPIISREKERFASLDRVLVWFWAGASASRTAVTT